MCRVDDIPSPRVFISYSHDSADHKDRVLALANRLRLDGIDAELDQYEISPPEGWPRWMERGLTESDFVLVICTEMYERRFRGQDEAGRGLGSRWEGAILTQLLYESLHGNVSFIPVLFSRLDDAHVPVILRGSTRYLLYDDYEKLYRHLINQPATVRPPLGNLRPMPPRTPPVVVSSAPTDAVAEGQQVEWATYVNTRFKFAIKYPASWPVGAESENGDGIRLYIGDPEVEVSVFASQHYEDIAPLEVNRDGLLSSKFSFKSGLSGEVLYGWRNGWRIFTAFFVEDNRVVQFWARGPDDFIRHNERMLYAMALSLSPLGLSPHPRRENSVRGANSVKRKTAEFTARGNDGQSYNLLVFTDFIPAATFEDPHGEVQGLRELRTSRGESVNYVSKGHYTIVSSGVELTSDDPTAP
jgi:hypothetical protein